MGRPPIKLGVSGALGKMGSRILTLASEDKDFNIALALEHPDHPDLGKPAAGLKSSSSTKGIQGIGVLVDFSSPEATLVHLKQCIKFKKPVVIGTTGLSDSHKKQVVGASKKIPIVFSPNMSVGVNVLFDLVRAAACRLPQEYSAHITEAHHQHKKDAPSGTAKFLAEIIKSQRRDAEVPMASIREGEVIGDHEVVFDSPWDSLKLIHSAKTRDIFAKGSLAAAKFIVTKKKGLFTMTDVIGAGL